MSDDPRLALDESAIAHHEAGHAVTAWCLGKTIILVSIQMVDGTAPFTRYGEVPSHQGDVTFDESGVALDEDRVSILLAGWIAERQAFPQARLAGAVVDIHQVLKTLHAVAAGRSMDEYDRHARLVIIEHETQALIARDDTRAAVSRVARELLRRRMIPLRRFEALMAEAPPERVGVPRPFPWDVPTVSVS